MNPKILVEKNNVTLMDAGHEGDVAGFKCGICGSERDGRKMLYG